VSNEEVTLRIIDVYKLGDRVYMTLEAPTPDTVVWYKDVFVVEGSPDVEVRVAGTLELRAFDDRRPNVVDVLPFVGSKTGVLTAVESLVGRCLRRISSQEGNPLAVKILPNNYNITTSHT